MTTELRTERLLLRRWRAEDEAPMIAVNRDPEVARYLNRPVDEPAVRGFHGFIHDHWEQHGFGPWAVEVADGGPLQGRFVGFAGLAFPPPLFADLVARPELGWRLAREAWGAGYATEAAAVARDDALQRIGAHDLMSIIHPENVRSQRVATKLGMALAFQVHNPLLGRDVDVWEPGRAGTLREGRRAPHAAGARHAPSPAARRPPRCRPGSPPSGPSPASRPGPRAVRRARRRRTG
jgi:RimJ/RimL family protein N-acetyltransferase